jgi:hypothetical protein
MSLRASELFQLPESPNPEQIPRVENTWKCCGMCRLTGFDADDMVIKFRGQPDALLGSPRQAGPSRPGCAPLRRKAIRSLTTRLNVPVVRERIRA